MSNVEIIKGYIPGSIGWVAELHGTFYQEHWNFTVFFEAKVATELSEFLGRYDEKLDSFWTASLKGRVEDSIAIDGIHAEKEGAHLRWFIVSDVLRGRGSGNRLIKEALNFCRNKGYKRVYLWTFEGLNAAKHLYEKNGFELVEQNEGIQWGTEVNKQRFELRFE